MNTNSRQLSIVGDFHLVTRGMNPNFSTAPAISRRGFGRILAAAACAVCVGDGNAETTSGPAFKLRYTLASSLFGKTSLREILPLVEAAGADSIDLWPAPHGTQREEADAMGDESLAALLREQSVRLEALTRYDLGPFGLGKEMDYARKLGASTIITGGSGPANLTGDALRAAVREFAEKLKPHITAAEEKGVKIAIENHGGNIIESQDAIRWLVEALPSPHLGIALAPYHLAQDPALLAELITDLGPRLFVFYAWQHGNGAMRAQPKEQELLQLPGRGTLDFTPLLRALKKIQYRGVTEIFMHPFPRGIPILEPISAAVDEINRARRYLDERLARL
jgi:sugar phosphate isomerase/epimerase